MTIVFLCLLGLLWSSDLAWSCVRPRLIMVRIAVRSLTGRVVTLSAERHDTVQQLIMSTMSADAAWASEEAVGRREKDG